MTIAFTAGIAAAAISLAVTLICAAWVVVRLVAVRRLMTRLEAKAPLRALKLLPAANGRIQASLRRLRSTGERLDAASREILAAAESGARFAVEVKMVATATEDLLDTLIPSMRGCA